MISMKSSILIWILASVNALIHAGGTGRSGCVYPGLIDATSEQLRDGLTRGCFGSVDLVVAYTKRIQDVNSTLHAVLEINPDALDIARQLDQERRSGHTRGPLHGLPVLLKDTIGTKDTTETAAGSYALVGAKPPADSTVAAKLRENGFVILGKSSLTEWANMRSLNSSNEWGARGGQTYAAYHARQDPNGSSSGSAVGADLGLAFAAIGTETSGSILLPSEMSNIVGIKPTVGLTSRYMVIPISKRQDTIGPMARTVRDAALLLQAIAGPDPKDNYTLVSPFGTRLPDYAAACTLSGLRGKRIGIPENVLGTLGASRAPVAAAFETAVALMASAGATIVRGTNFTAYEAFLNDTTPQVAMALDFVSEISQYLSAIPCNANNLHNLKDIQQYTQHSRFEEYPTRDTGIWDLALATGLNNTSPEFWAMYQKSLYYGGEGGILGALARHRLDAVVLPTYLAGDIPALVGTPAITVPMGAFHNGTVVEYNTRGDLVNVGPGIPFGVSFLGAKWSETALIGMAYAFEQRTLARETLRRVVEPRSELGGV